jgi:hypothetical protein
MFSTHKSSQNIVQQNSGNYIIELFENLNTIRIQNGDDLFNYYLSRYVSNDYLSYNNENLYNSQRVSRNTDRTELYYNIIEKMMQFPIDMIDGLLYGNYSADLNLNKEFVDLCNIVFQNVYTVDGSKVWIELNVTTSPDEPSNPQIGDYWFDSNADTDKLKIRTTEGWVTAAYQTTSNTTNVDFGTLYYDSVNSKLFVLKIEDPSLVTGTDFSHNTDLETFLEEPIDILDSEYTNNNDEDLDELISVYSEKLILSIDAINTLFASEEFMQFRFSLKQNEEQTLGFVETAVELFLSYTAQLYSSEFKREYKTPSESAPLSEKITHILNANRTDYLYYDEQLDIQRTEGDE